VSEQLDVVDPSGRIVGRADRSTVHREGHWHQVFHCLLVRTTSPARVVLQRRHAAAASFQGLLDITAGGHLEAGETPLDGVRELREELGVDVSPDRLVPLGRRLLVDDSGEGDNREVAHVFLLPDDRELATFDLDGCDVDGLVELTVADLLRILDDTDAVAPCTELHPDGTISTGSCRVRDLVPAIDGYWTVLAVMAERFANGERPLAI
jgi:8-oxo-dGTP pyrophosphatase MutT (NUDIX family)